MLLLDTNVSGFIRTENRFLITMLGRVRVIAIKCWYSYTRLTNCALDEQIKMSSNFGLWIQRIAFQVCFFWVENGWTNWQELKLWAVGPENCFSDMFIKIHFGWRIPYCSVFFKMAKQVYMKVHGVRNPGSWSKSSWMDCDRYVLCWIAYNSLTNTLIINKSWSRYFSNI